jgi:hypothetical protein
VNEEQVSARGGTAAPDHTPDDLPAPYQLPPPPPAGAIWPDLTSLDRDVPVQREKPVIGQVAEPPAPSSWSAFADAWAPPAGKTASARVTVPSANQAPVDEFVGAPPAQRRPAGVYRAGEAGLAANAPRATAPRAAEPPYPPEPPLPPEPVKPPEPPQPPAPPQPPEPKPMPPPSPTPRPTPPPGPVPAPPPGPVPPRPVPPGPGPFPEPQPPVPPGPPTPPPSPPVPGPSPAPPFPPPPTTIAPAVPRAQWRVAPPTGLPPNGPPAAAISPEYSQWARNQHAQGNVYGGYNPNSSANSSLENSGSLTGHILAQGLADTAPQRGRTTKVIMIMSVVLGVAVVIGLLAATVASKTISGLLGGMVGGK